MLGSKKASLILISTVKLENLSNIKIEIIYKLKSNCIPPGNIKEHLFDQNDCDSGVVSIAYLIEVF